MRLADFAALSFDCYGTLIDWETGILAALRPWQRRAGVTADDNALLERFGDSESRVEAEHPTMLYPELLATTLKAMARRLQAPAADDEADAFGQSVKDWPAFADSAAALAYLKQHYKLVILSNIDRASFALSNRRLGVAFDAIVTAEDVGSYKPALRHFEVGLKRLADMGVPKDKVLHTAQSLHHDHVPAKRLGLATMWINRRAGKRGAGATKTPAESVKPDWELPTLAAMVDMHRAESGRS